MELPSPDDTTKAMPSLGLSGIWATIANFSAVVLLGTMFWVQSDDMRRTAREDRAMCREEARQQWQAVREGQATIMRLTRSVEEIGVEVRALRARQSNGGGKGGIDE